MAQSCQNCLEKLGGSTGKKVFACGRCKRATYCSKQCQREDYPRHKLQCLNIVEQQQFMAQLAQQLPGLDRYEKDSQKFRKTVHAEAAVAARSLLRVGTKDSLHDSHYVVMSLQYEPVDGPLRKSYSFKEVDVRAFDEGEGTTAELGPQRELMRKVRETMRTHDPYASMPNSKEKFFRFVTCLRVDWVGSGGPFAKEFPLISIISKGDLEYFHPLASWPPNPALPSLLRRIFAPSHPLPTHSIFRDDYLSTFPGTEARKKVMLLERLDRDELVKEGVEFLK